MNRHSLIIFLLFLCPFVLQAQQHIPTDSESVIDSAADTLDEDKQKAVISELKYIKQPGFANAASKIFSADQRFTLSGFGEINYVNYSSVVPDKQNKEIEQYYSNLYRLGTYLGYRLSDRIVFMSEVQMEYLHDGFRESHFEMNVEATFDFLLNPYFNIRVGNYPLGLGWVNVNEEPIAFYTVNRPEVERIMIPSQWLEKGVLFYGNLIQDIDLEYHFGITKGLDASGFTSGTWIRNGRYHSWTELPESYAVNGKLHYGHEDDVLISLAGYHGDASAGNRLPDGRPLQSNLSLLTAVGSYTMGDLSLFGLYSRGWLSGTEQIYQVNNEIVGEQTQGYYAEMRYNILPMIKPGSDWKLPLFARYERLNTHMSIHENLQEELFNPQAIADLKDLEIITVGLNVRPRKSMTFKVDYQFRQNLMPGGMPEPNQFEMGVGFIF